MKKKSMQSKLGFMASLIVTAGIAACGSEEPEDVSSIESALLCHAPGAGTYALSLESAGSPSGCASPPWTSPVPTIGSQVTGPVSGMPSVITAADLQDAVELLTLATYPSSAGWSCGVANELLAGCNLSFSMDCTRGSETHGLWVNLSQTGRSKGKDFYRIYLTDGGSIASSPCHRSSSLTFKQQ
jgi:hypothetical protein